MRGGLGRALWLVLLWAGVPVWAAEGDANVARKNKISMCVGCHGIPGYRTSFPDTYNVPKLGGQHADYIAAALKAYRAGERDHPSMRAVAASLSDQDIADLAAYYAGQEQRIKRSQR